MLDINCDHQCMGIYDYLWYISLPSFLTLCIGCCFVSCNVGLYNVCWLFKFLVFVADAVDLYYFVVLIRIFS